MHAYDQGSGYSPWADLAGRPHITFGITRLPAGQGWWLPDEQAIVLDDRLNRTERRTVLAHELAHVDRDDRNCAADGPDGPRIARRCERHADALAASRLVTLLQLADALSWARGPQEVADELDVTVPMLRRRLIELTEDERAWVEAQISDIEGAA